jgi:hypothetical protein
LIVKLGLQILQTVAGVYKQKNAYISVFVVLLLFRLMMHSSLNPQIATADAWRAAVKHICSVCVPGPVAAIFGW